MKPRDPEAEVISIVLAIAVVALAVAALLFLRWG